MQTLYTLMNKLENNGVLKAIEDKIESMCIRAYKTKSVTENFDGLVGIGKQLYWPEVVENYKRKDNHVWTEIYGFDGESLTAVLCDLFTKKDKLYIPKNSTFSFFLVKFQITDCKQISFYELQNNEHKTIYSRIDDLGMTENEKEIIVKDFQKIMEE